MSRAIFTETQKFDQLWIRLLVFFTTVPLLGLLTFGIYQQIILGIPFGSKPAPDAVLIIIFVFILVLTVLLNGLFLTLRLITEVTDEGLSYRFPPLIRQTKIIRKEEITEYTIRKYSPIREYGGWGIRWGGGRTGNAYNVKGNMGLQLQLRNGKNVLFGTQRSDALLAAVDKMKKPPLT